MLPSSRLDHHAPPAPVPPPVSIAPALPMVRRAPRYEPARNNASPWPAARPGSPRPPRTVSVRNPVPPPRPEPVVPAALVRAQQVFRVTLEVLEGRRGPAQLPALMSPEVVARVTTYARDYTRMRAQSTARLRRVHVQQVTPGVAEACATVERNGRTQAIAARMELGKDGWRCTALRLC